MKLKKSKVLLLSIVTALSTASLSYASENNSVETFTKYNLEDGSQEELFINSAPQGTMFAPSDGKPVVPRDIIEPTDDRYEMNPYDSRFVYLSVTFPDGSKSSGSGFMISNTAVATAAHVVCDTGNNYVVASSVTAYPGLKGAPSSSSKRYTSKNIVVSSNYTVNHNTDFDYAVVELSSTANVGYLGFTGEHSSGLNIHLTGYPGDYPHKQYRAPGNITKIESARLRYNADAAGGQSGSPVHESNGTVHAIHTAGGGTFNTGIKINATIFNLFMQYR